MRTIGSVLRTVRINKGKMQQQVAAECGISESMVSAIELGIRDPKWGMLVSLCKSLGISPAMVVMLVEAEENPALAPYMPFVHETVWGAMNQPEVQHG